MAKSNVTQYDTTAANNLDVGSISIAEGMAPSNVNNAIRELMAHTANWVSGSQAVTALTVTGEVDAGSLDVSGSIDVDGTTNLDAVDIDGAVQIDNTVTVGVDDTGYDFKLFGDTASAYLLWDTSADDLILAGAAGLVVPDSQFTLGSTAVTSTAAEINLIDGGTARGTTAVASGDGILINDAGTMRMTNVDTVSTYFASHSVGGSNIVTTGALNSGSITSGFGSIDNGSSAITTTGTISGLIGVNGAAPAAATPIAIPNEDYLVWHDSGSSGGTAAYARGVGGVLHFGGSSYTFNGTGAATFGGNVNATTAGAQFLVGHSSYINTGTNAYSQIHYSNKGNTLLLGEWSATNASEPTLRFLKSASSTIGTNTLVADDENLGAIAFNAADGTDLYSVAATIKAYVDGTPGASDMPGRLEFGTTADGADAPTTRMTIDAGGKVGIGTAPGNLLDLKSGTQYQGLRLNNASNVVAELLGFGSGNDAGGLKLREGGTAKVELYANGDSKIAGGDLLLAHDGAVLKFGTDSDVTATHVHDVGLNFASTRSGADSIFRFSNSANASASDVRVIIQNGGTSGGDPLINFDGQASNATWSVGVDTSATKFVIADADKGGFDGSDEVLTIATGGDATFAGDIIVGDTSSGSQVKIKASDTTYSSIRLGSASNADACLITTRYDQNKFEIITQDVGHSIRLAPDNNATNLTLSGASGSETAVFAGSIKLGGETASANALDDYEEGTWTPTFTGSTTSGSSQAYSAQEGRYTKIGRMVHIVVHLDMSSIGTAAGNIQISIPFAAVNNSASQMGLSLAQCNAINLSSGYTQIGAALIENTSYFLVMESGDNVGSLACQCSAFGGTLMMQFSGCYEAA